MTAIRSVLCVWASLLPVFAAEAPELPDIRTVAPDLQAPPVVQAEPAAGMRVLQVEPEYAGAGIHHTLYLPRDWEPARRFPMIVEYPGNGPYENRYGDVSTGEVEGCQMGYGLTAGKGFIWLALPFVNTQSRTNQRQWWGDVEATADYAKRAVRRVCERFGGDPSAVILAGFSRGAIACNYIGLHDDEIADLWLAFMPYSHYDGVRLWDYPGAGRADALVRLQRLQGRASFITHERSVDETRSYIEQTGIIAPFSFHVIPYRNHNSAWTLRDIPARSSARRWLARVLIDRPGTHAIRGRVTGADGRPLAGARIESGAHHWTTSAADGSYELLGLTGAERWVEAQAAGVDFQLRSRKVSLTGGDAANIDFTAAAGDSK